MADKFGFVKDAEDMGFVADRTAETAVADIGFQPETTHLDFEAGMQDEKKRKEQQATFIQQLKAQAEQEAQDPKNWTLKQTKDHFKTNPPKTPQEEAAMNLMLKQKKDQIDNMMNTELRAAPPPTLKQTIQETIHHFLQGTGLAKTDEEIQAHDQNIYALSKVYDLPTKIVEKNYQAIASQIFPRDPNLGELLTVLSVPPIAAGLALAPGATILGLTGFQILSEIENAAVSKIKGEKYQFMRARGVADLLPEEASDASKGLVELLDMLGKGLMVGGMMRKAPVLAQRFTKDIITNYKLPEKLYLSTEKLQAMSEGQFRDYFQRDLNLSNQDLRSVIMARREGKPVQIEIPAEKVTSLVDKPYWAKIKDLLNVKPIERVLKITPAGPVTAGQEVPALPAPEVPPQPAAGGMTHKVPEMVQKMLDKGVTITGRETPIRMEQAMAVTDLSGKKVTLPKGEEYTPYKLSNNQVWLHDGKNIVINKNQLQNVANQNLVLGEKSVSPEEQQIETVVKSAEVAQQVPSFDQQSAEYRMEEINNELNKFGYKVEADPNGMQGEVSVNDMENNYIEPDELMKQNPQAAGLVEEFSKIARTITEGQPSPNAPQFSEQVLRGGENYKEILFRTPTAPGNFHVEYNDKTQTYNAIDDTTKKILASENTESAAAQVAQDILGITGSSYKSPHWEETNVISHVRINDRVTPEGKKILFIEEIQSDWAREARKTDPYLVYLKTLEEKYNITQEKGLLDKLTPEEDSRLDELSSKEPPPEAHLLLKNWQEFTLKRLLDYAVKNGYDGISWTTGQQQAERYDLSKHFKEIQWTKEGGRDKVYYGVGGILQNGETHNFGTIPAAELDKYVGKEIAEKIKKKEGIQGKLSSLDLKIGGEWAKSLYDTQIPSILKSLTKGNVSTVNLEPPLVFKGQIPGAGKGEFPKTQPYLEITPEVKSHLIAQPKAGGLTFDAGQEAENLYDKMPPEQQAEFDLEMDDLRKTPEGNLFVAIKQLGGIRPYESTGAQVGTKFMAEELKGIPASLKNKNATHALDTIVSELKTFGWHFDSSDELLEAIKTQAVNPIEKVNRADLRAVIREADKNKKLQQDILDRMKKRRKFIQTVKSADKTAPEVKQKIESRYEPITNAETLKQAQDYVNTDYNAAIELVEGPSRASTFSNAVAIVLIDKAQAEGRFSDAIRLVEKTAEKNTSLGQAIQALAMYERLTPEGVLQYAEQQVRRAREGIKQKERLTNFEKIAKTLKTQSEKDKLAEKLGIPHISEIVAGELRKMAERIQEMPPSRDKQIEEALLLKKISDQIPPSLGKKIAMIQTLAQLLNPKTFIRNILGNVGFQVAENISDVFGTMLDISASLRTGKRTVYMPNISSQATGLVQGLKEGTQEALLGISLKSGPTQTKFSLPSNGVFNKGVLSGLEKAMRISLSATDRGFYQSAFNQSIRQQCLAAGVDEPTEEMIEKANYIGLYRTFNDDNMVSDFFVRLKRLLNLQKDFGLGDIVIKYPRTPSNILARGVEYSPFGFIKTVFELGRPLFRQGPFNQEEFVRSTSRAFTGSALLVGAGAILATLGIISGKRAKDKDVAATREQVGIREYQFNTSALKRFIASGLDPELAKIREDDTLVTYDWFLPGSIGLALGANLILNPKENLVDKTMNLGDQILQASETLQQQPLVSGLKVLTSKQNLAEGVSEVIQNIPSSFIPTALNQIRQLTDNTARNTRDPNYFKEIYNRAAMRIPGLAGTLPPKVDILGKPKEMYQMDSNNPFNVLLNPAFVNKYKPDPVSKMVLDIWESTGETIQFPRVAQTKIKLGTATKEPIELSPGQYTEFQKYIGIKTNVLFNILANNPKFLAKPDDEKAKLLQGYLTDINTAAKAEILGYRPKHVSHDVITIIKYIGRDKRQIDQNAKTEDLGFTPETDLGFVPEGQ